MLCFRQNLILWTKCIYAIIFHKTSGFNVTIISLLPYSIDVAVSLPWTGPALLAAVNDTNRLFEPHQQAALKLLFNKKHQTCAGARGDIPRMLGEFYYQQKLEGFCVAIIGANCIDMSTVAYLAREWDVITFAIGPVPEEVVNNDLAFLMGGSTTGMAVATLTVMKHFGWKHATVLLDGSSFTDFYSQYATGILRRRKQGMIINVVSVKKMTETALAESLQVAALQSRVIIISAQIIAVLRILKIASKLNMTNGDYAFINFQPTVQEPYGKLRMFSNRLPEELPGIQSLILITSRQNEVDARRSQSLNQRLRRLSQNLYNTSFDEDLEPLDSFLIRGAYDSIDFFMRQLNTSLKNANTCSGKEMAAKVTNRTFALRTGKAFIDENGVREIDSVVYRFSSNEQSMKSVGFFDSSSRTLSWDSSVTTPWPNGITPVDIPRCGFRGLDESCMLTNHSWDTDLKVALPVILITVILLVATLTWHRNSYARGKNKNKLWILDHVQLKPHGRRTSSIRAVSQIPHVF